MYSQVEQIKSEIKRLLRENEVYEKDNNTDAIMYQKTGAYHVLSELEHFVDSLPEELSDKVWKPATEEPKDREHCLIYFGTKGKVGHLDFELVFYNKKEKVFITESYPHPTGYKVEQKSFDGGCSAEVYKDKRDRISINDIHSWANLEKLLYGHNIITNISDQEESAKEYSFNIESTLFNQLTPEQQKEWKKEIEQAYMAGGKLYQNEKYQTVPLKILDRLYANEEKLEKMLNEAISGIIICNDMTGGYKDILFEKIPDEFKVDDKVKIIILPRE